MNALQKLRSIVEELRAPSEPMKILDNWNLAGRLLSRMPAVDQGEAERAIKERDIEAIDAIVTRLENPDIAEVQQSQSAAPARRFKKEELSTALRAFRKRLKVMRLEDESKLGGRHTSGGKSSKIDAIMPPGEFPREIWTALDEAGKLVHTGQGFYMEAGSAHLKPPRP